MTDLMAKLEAAIAETEKIALAALSHPGEWSRAGTWVQTGTDDGKWHTGEFNDDRRVDGIGITIYDEGGHDEDQAAHIAHNDPNRVLRRVARDRKLLELHRPQEITLYLYSFNPDEGDNTVEPVELSTCSTCTAEGSNVSSLPGRYCATFRLLAEDYEIEVES